MNHILMNRDIMNRRFKIMLFALYCVSSIAWASEKNQTLRNSMASKQHVAAHKHEKEIIPNDTAIALGFSSKHESTNAFLSTCLESIKVGLNKKNKTLVNPSIELLLALTCNQKFRFSTTNPKLQQYAITLQINNATANERDWGMVVEHANEVPDLINAIHADEVDNKNSQETKEFFKKNAFEALEYIAAKSVENEITLNTEISKMEVVEKKTTAHSKPITIQNKKR